MSCSSWKCRCAMLESSYDRRLKRWRTPAGEYACDYHCKAKLFFTSILGYTAFMKVGGWVSECRNHACSSLDFKTGKCKSQSPTGWCNQCVWGNPPDSWEQCSYRDPELCPFAKLRSADQWIRHALQGLVPLLTRSGRICSAARAAKRHFGISDKAFAQLVAKKLQMVAADKKAIEDAQKMIDESKESNERQN